MNYLNFHFEDLLDAITQKDLMYLINDIKSKGIEGNIVVTNVIRTKLDYLSEHLEVKFVELDPLTNNTHWRWRMTKDKELGMSCSNRSLEVNQ